MPQQINLGTGQACYPVGFACSATLASDPSKTGCFEGDLVGVK